MSKLVFSLLFMTTTVIACNNNSDNSGHEMDSMQEENASGMHDGNGSEKEIKTIAVTFSETDPGVNSFMKSVTGDYLSIKNALVSAQVSEARTSAAAMQASLKNFDKSTLTAEQKKVFDESETGLKESSLMISEENDLEKQRSHFVHLSKYMLNMVQAFGAGMTLYQDHCPMYQDGSDWLSETKEIRNPFYGDKMMTCGSPVGMIK